MLNKIEKRMSRELERVERERIINSSLKSMKEIDNRMTEEDDELKEFLERLDSQK